MRANAANVSAVARRLDLDGDDADMEVLFTDDADKISDAGDGNASAVVSTAASATASSSKIVPTSIVKCYYNPYKLPQEIDATKVELLVDWDNSKQTWQSCHSLFQSHPELVLSYLSKQPDDEHFCCLLRKLKSQSTRRPEPAQTRESTRDRAPDSATTASIAPAATTDPVQETNEAPDSATTASIAPAAATDPVQETKEEASDGDASDRDTPSRPSIQGGKGKNAPAKAKGSSSAKRRSKAASIQHKDNGPIIGCRMEKDFGEEFGVCSGSGKE